MDFKRGEGLLERQALRDLTAFKRRNSAQAFERFPRPGSAEKENRENAFQEGKEASRRPCAIEGRPSKEVRSPPRAPGRATGLSAHLMELGGIDSTAAPLVGDVLQAMHAAELRMRTSAGHLEQHVNLEHRRKVVAWLVKAFHVVSFDDAVLYQTVQLADLYLSHGSKYVCGSILQGVVMACVCTTLKLATPDHRVYSVPDLIAHITHSQITLDRVLRVEREVLNGLGFNLSTPTAGMFLDVFGFRIGSSKFGDWGGLRTYDGPPVEAVVGGPSVLQPKLRHLADYILQLAMLNHELLDFLPSELAGASLVLAVWTLGGPAAAKVALLEDIRACQTSNRADLQGCVLALHGHWRAPSDPDAMVAVREKFSTDERMAVAEIAPIACPPTV